MASTSEENFCASCGKVAKSSCATCKDTFYCDRTCQTNHWPSHKKECKGKKQAPKQKDVVFEKEADMIAAMKAMGMPADMIKNLTPEQKKALLKMTANPDVIARAEERVKQSNAAFPTNIGFEGKSADGKAAPVPSGKYSWLDGKSVASVEIPCPLDVDKKDITVTLEKDSIIVKVGNDVVLDGPLFQTINKAKSTWNFINEDKDDRILCVKLEKEKPMRWVQILRM